MALTYVTRSVGYLKRLCQQQKFFSDKRELEDGDIGLLESGKK
jgi:hypothetical protein